MAIHKLKQLQVEKNKTPGMFNDGGGLYLRVRSETSKNWIYRYKFEGKTIDMGLGSYPTVTLAEARSESAKWRKVKSEGSSPKAERDKQRQEEAEENNKVILSFSECATKYIEAHKAEWTNKKHIQQWENTIQTYANPTMGNVPINEITVQMVLAALNPIWRTKVETATRVRQRIESIIDWAAAHGYRSSDNPARLKGHLDKLLPKSSKLKKVRHHPALPYERISELMAKLKLLESISAKALQFTILTGLRTGEVLGAKWPEIDLVNNIWTVPAVRMKTKKEHRVPLTNSSIKLLNELPKIVDNEHLFFGAKHGRHLSNMTMLTLLQRGEDEHGLGYSDVTVHGFRSTFRDWAAEQTSFPRELCEIALAHEVRSSVESAYQRGDLLEKRRALMQTWDVYIQSL